MQQFRADRPPWRGHASGAGAARPRWRRFETFLALEAAGWKGKAGTAIACLPRDAAYFRRLVDAACREDALLVDALLLDDQPLAMGVLVESAGTGVISSRSPMTRRKRGTRPAGH